MSDLPTYVVDRKFEASREMVWRAWTEPELLARWYGPGVDTIIHKFDLREGGEWLNEMKRGEYSMLSRAVFTEVLPPERLAWRQYSSTDRSWQSIPNPQMPDWPRIMLTTVTFSEQDGVTNVRLEWAPYEATEAEIACFAGAVANLGKGWESGFALMDQLFAELQA
jgi:uncharacterized protein YndB with AHSA1/START domain